MNTEASRLLTVSDLYEFSIFAGFNLMVVEVAFVFKIFFMVLLSPAIILGTLLFFSSVFTHRLEYIRVKGYLFVIFANFFTGCLSSYSLIFFLGLLISSGFELQSWVFLVLCISLSARVSVFRSRAWLDIFF